MRNEFRIPRRADGTETVYLCGHSLGLQPKVRRAFVQEELDSWAQRAVDGHFESQRPWLSYHERFAPSLARLVGAQPLEVVAMNTLTVNLHLMLATFYRPTRERPKILIEKHARRTATPSRRRCGCTDSIRAARCWKSDRGPAKKPCAPKTCWR